MIEGRAGIAMGHDRHIVAEVMIETRIRIHIGHDRLDITGYVMIEGRIGDLRDYEYRGHVTVLSHDE